MAVKDVVAAGRLKRGEVGADGAPPATEPQAMVPSAEVPAPAPPAPTAPAPKYAEGAKVASSDTRRPAGAVTGTPATEPVYTITPDDGSPPYKSAESETEPYTEPVEEPMTDETIAPAGMAQTLGLKAGATMGEVNAAIKAQGETLERERTEARDAALTVAGMKGDLMPAMAGTVTRAEGQTWGDAVAAHKATYPSAYHAAKPTVEPAANGEAPEGSKPAPKPPGSTPLAEVGAALPDGTVPKAKVTQSGPATGKDAISAFRARLDAQYNGQR